MAIGVAGLGGRHGLYALTGLAHTAEADAALAARLTRKRGCDARAIPRAHRAGWAIATGQTFGIAGARPRGGTADEPLGLAVGGAASAGIAVTGWATDEIEAAERGRTEAEERAGARLALGAGTLAAILDAPKLSAAAAIAWRALGQGIGAHAAEAGEAARAA